MASEKEYIQSELLVTRYLQGDHRTFEELVRLWRDPLYFYVRRLASTEQDAWDILQDAWIKVNRKLRRLQEPAAFPAWLFKIARNAAMDHTRKMRSQSRVPEEEQMGGAEPTTNTFSLALDAEQLHWGLSKLTQSHREVLILHFLEGFTLAEISDITGTPLGTVKSRTHYALNTLRKLFEKEEY